MNNRTQQCLGMEDLTLEQIKSEVRHLDPALKEDHPAFSTAVVLIAAAFAVGPEIDELVLFTGYPEAIISEIARRMRASGLWSEQGVETEHWFRGDDSWTAGIWADALVAQIFFEVRRGDDGVLKYRAIYSLQ
jgi:hypothetical protein